MENTKAFLRKYSALLPLLLSIWASFLFYPILPSQIPVHWNINSNPDNFAAKEQGVLLFPGIIAVITVFFYIIPKIDPRREAYQSFRKEYMAVMNIVLYFLVFIQITSFYATINSGFQITRVIFAAIGLMFVLLGKYIAGVKPNYFVGIRLPWTLENPKNWVQTHKFAAKVYLVSGVAILLLSFLLTDFMFVFIFILIAAFLPIIYSFVLFQRTPTKR